MRGLVFFVALSTPLRGRYSQSSAPIRPCPLNPLKLIEGAQTTPFMGTVWMNDEAHAAEHQIPVGL